MILSIYQEKKIPSSIEQSCNSIQRPSPHPCPCDPWAKINLSSPQKQHSAQREIEKTCIQPVQIHSETANQESVYLPGWMTICAPAPKNDVHVEKKRTKKNKKVIRFLPFHGQSILPLPLPTYPHALASIPSPVCSALISALPESMRRRLWEEEEEEPGKWWVE